MATTITKTGTMYLRPSAWVDQGDFTETSQSGIITHSSGYSGADNAWSCVNEATSDDGGTTIWTYCTSFSNVQTGDGTFKCGLCNETPVVPYTITGISCFARGECDKTTGVWSASPKVAKVCLNVIGNGGTVGDGSDGGTTVDNEEWTDITKSIGTSVLSSTSYSANTIPDLNLRIVNRAQGKWNSGQFYLKITQLYIKIDYQYTITVDVNDSAVGSITGTTGSDSTTTASMTTGQIGGSDHYFAGWYTTYDSAQKDHYKYTNKVGSDLTYNWSTSAPYMTLYAVWYDYPIQIAAGSHRVKHIYAGTTEITNVYNGTNRLYWANAKWDEL